MSWIANWETEEEALLSFSDDINDPEENHNAELVVKIILKETIKEIERERSLSS